MLYILILFSLLQVSSTLINCRISCRRCREKTDHPDLMEVYCAMCLECKERRREWLQGPPSISIRNKEPAHHLPTDNDADDDCCPPLTEDPCEEQPHKLTGSPEPYTTTTTTTTSSTTRRPCLPKPKCVKPCAVPVLPMLPMLPMCSMCPLNQYQQISTAAMLNEHTKQTLIDSMYLYLGVPKTLLNELKLEKKV